MSSNDTPSSGDPLAGLSGLRGRNVLSYLIEQAPIGVAVLRPQDREGRASGAGAAGPRVWRYVLSNAAYCAMPGTASAPIVDRKSLVGLTLAEVFPPETAQRIADTLDHVRRSGKAVLFQEQEAAMGAGREQTWWHVADHPLYDDEGQVAAILVLIYDVTDQVLARRRAEALAGEAENERRRLRAMMEALPVGVAITDARGGPLLTNHAYDQLWGSPRPETHAVDDYEAYRAWWVDSGRRVKPEEWASAEALRTGQTVRNQVMEIERFDGSRAFVLNSAAPVRDASGQIVGSAVAVRDITSLREAEAALRASEASYRALFKAMNEGLAVHEMLFDAQGRPYDYRFLEVNPAFERQTGLQAAQVLGRTVREVLPNLEPQWIERYGQVVLSGEPTYFEAEAGALGRWYGVLAFRTQPGHFAVLFLDITERRRTEEALRLSEEHLRLANETLEQRVIERTALAEERAEQLRALAVELTRTEERERRRLAGLLHDHLQQLLAAASLQLHVAEPRASAGAQAAVRQALDLVDQAIRASRSLTVELSPVILHDAGLAPALHWLGRWMLQQHGLQVAVETPAEDAPEAKGRPPLPEESGALLFHSARELLYNVVKHAGVDRATLRLSYPTAEAIQLEVADEGRGYRIEDTLPVAGKRGEEAGPAWPGLLGGFGLFSIRERLAYMGGRFSVESGLGRGTRVTLTLPLARAPEAAPQAEAGPQSLEEKGAPESPREARKLRLLVADDHAIVRKGLVGLLNAELDLEVVGEAGDGLEAVARVREQNPDVVLVDLNMPRMDGIEATRRILAEHPHVRVIVLSMFDDSEKRAYMKQLGAADYVAKGGDPASLVEAIRAAYRPDTTRRA